MPTPLRAFAPTAWLPAHSRPEVCPLAHAPSLGVSTARDLVFLGCVVVAGVYGAITVSRKILFIQAAPAAIAIVLAVLSR